MEGVEERIITSLILCLLRMAVAASRGLSPSGHQGPKEFLAALLAARKRYMDAFNVAFGRISFIFFEQAVLGCSLDAVVSTFVSGAL